jgi:hypothetical protein
VSKLHQLFIGCPFQKAVRKNFDRLKSELEAETPLHVVLADTAAVTTSDYLLEHITGLIRDSAGCVFDATGANPNVSLEVGVAHAIPANYLITMSTRKPRAASASTGGLTARGGEVKPIISDLQGKNRIEYKNYPSLKKQLVARYVANLPYMRRWNEFKRQNSSFAAPALQLFSDLRVSGRTLRPRVSAALEGTGIRVDDLLSALSSAKLVSVKRGRAGGIYYPPK